MENHYVQKQFCTNNSSPSLLRAITTHTVAQGAKHTDSNFGPFEDDTLPTLLSYAPSWTRCRSDPFSFQCWIFSAVTMNLKLTQCHNQFFIHYDPIRQSKFFNILMNWFYILSTSTSNYSHLQSTKQMHMNGFFNEKYFTCPWITNIKLKCTMCSTECKTYFSKQIQVHTVFL